MREDQEVGHADRKRILELLPHRPPFLFIDEVREMRAGVSAVGFKQVRAGDSYFEGHFPGYPVMPAVIITEAMAQTAGALVMHTLGNLHTDELVYFMTIDRARFRRPVTPDCTLRIPVKVLHARGMAWRFSGEAFVGDKLAAEAIYSAMIVKPAEPRMTRTK